MYTPSAPGPARRGGNPPVSVQQAQQMRGPAPAAMQQQMGGAGGAAAVASSRVGDMLDQVKAEYEAAIQQLNMSKMEQLELERKIQSQVVEMDQIQQTLKALEANHRRLRQQYEDDVMRMRRQLEGQQVVTQQPQQPPSAAPQQMPPQGPAGAKLQQPKRPRGGPQGGPGQDDSLMSNLVAAATSSRAPRANSPVRVVPVQPASRSLQQLGQNPPPLPPPPSSQGMTGSLPPPPSSQSMDGPNATTPTSSSSRRNTIPALNRGGDDPMNGKMDPRALPSMSAATSSSAGNGGGSPQPALKKPKLNGEGIAGLSNGKSSGGPLPSVGGASGSGSGPLLPKLHRESTDSSPSRTGSGSSASAAAPAASQGMSSASTTPTAGSAKGEKREAAGDADGSNGTTSVSASGSITSNATQKTSNSKASRLNWSCVYSSKSSMSYQESERPAAEMHQSMDHQSVVCCVRFSSDGTMMASGCHKTAQVFDVKTGDRKFSVSRPGSSNSGNANAAAASEADDAYVRAVCFSPDCTKIVAGMPQNTIRTWDIATNEEGPSMAGHESEIYSLDYVNDLIVSGSGDRKVRLWDARSGQCKKVFGSESGGPSDGVTSVALSPDGRLLAAASLDKVVRIWDTESSQLLDRLEGHSDSVYSIAFSPDGKNVISGSLDRNIMLWDVCAQGRTTTRPRMLFQGHKDFVLSVAYTPDGRWLMSGSKDRSVVFWDPRSSRSVLTLTGYRNSVISVASSPASPYFATGSGDCFAVIWKYQCQTF